MAKGWLLWGLGDDVGSGILFGFLATIYGVGLLIVLLNVIGITVAAAMLTIKGPA